MIDCSDVLDELVASVDHAMDPRIDGNNVRCVQGAGDRGTVLLVGVVHDHPASTYRVAHLIEAFPPDVVAVELPPLAMPLFRIYAEDRYTPPRMGGEMSMALQAFDDGRTVGIDAPNLAYFRRLAGLLREEDLSLGLVRELLTSSSIGVGQAIACRIGAVLASWTPLRLRVYDVFRHEATFLDSPAAQAEDEASHISQENALLRIIEAPRGMELIETAREETMATTLRDLRREGDVTAVVGRNHVEPLYSLLEDTY
jgi:pheromone shutdown protein TraB